jgi:hypothetical protein
MNLGYLEEVRPGALVLIIHFCIGKRFEEIKGDTHLYRNIFPDFFLVLN